jgi:hypothetical protein
LFTEVDKILYTDLCEVIEFPSQRFVHPIFKNGSFSLYKEQKEKQLRVHVNNQIKKIKKIEIYLREPTERFSLGYAKFIDNVLLDNPTFDRKTIEYFASNYLFLDKHFMPQFLWLYNLHRFTNKNCLFDLKHVSQLSLLTENHENQFSKRKNTDHIKNLDTYIRLENILYSLIDQSITWDQLIQLFIDKEPMLYKYIFREKDFNVLR